MSARRPTLDEPVIIARIWKSPRDRSRTITIALKSYEGRSFVDIRIFGTNSAGQSVPTQKGVTVGFKQFPELLHALDRARVKATELGLLDDESEAGE